MPDSFQAMPNIYTIFQTEPRRKALFASDSIKYFAVALRRGDPFSQAGFFIFGRSTEHLPGNKGGYIICSMGFHGRTFS